MAAGEPIAPLSRRALRDGVYDRLLGMLLDGTLNQDSSISIDGLARDLQVSPTPVREALVDLEHTGLIARQAMRGYRVAAPLSLDQVEAWVQARRIVEVGAMELAMQEPEALLAALEQAHARHTDIVQPCRDGAEERLADYQRYFDADWGFHLCFIRQAHNPYLVRMAETLGFQIHRLRETFPAGRLHVDEALVEHGRILEAVRTGETAAAVAAVEEHLDQVRARGLADMGRRLAGGQPTPQG